jgi:hypothetical protein
MNERIKELAEQAWIDTKEEFDSIVDDGGSINFTFAHAYDKKFAELIVRECCGAADEWYQKHNELHWDPAQHIRNHFGVEE